MAPNNPSMRDLLRIVENDDEEILLEANDSLRYADLDTSKLDLAPPTKSWGEILHKASDKKLGKLLKQHEPSKDYKDSAYHTIKKEYDRRQSISEAKERLIYPPIVYDGDGNKKSYELYHDAIANKKVGDTVTSHAAAPGMGKIVRRITRMDDTGVYGVKIEDTVQIMEPWMVEDENDARGTMCSVCSGQRREGYGSDCPNCGGEGYVTEDDHRCAQCGGPADGNEELCSECVGGFYEDANSEGFELEYDSMYGVYKLIVGDQAILLGTDDYEEAQREAEAMMQDPNFYESNKPYAGKGGEPYATMTDGPDKYLFRKDQKQKLVGSADNEPEDGEEELEETDMDKEIREMQIAAGIIVAEEVVTEECDNCRDWDPDDQNVCHECFGGRTGHQDPEDIEEGKLPDALKKHQFGKKDDDKEEEVDDKEEAVDEEVVEEDCDTGKDKNDDGECSPLTHIEIDEDDFVEDLLLAPEDPKGPEVDEDDMVYGKTGKGRSYGPKDFDQFGDEDQLSARSDRDMSDYEPRSDDYAMDEGPDSDDPSAMECPGCSDIAYRKIGSTDEFDEFECENCGTYGTHDRNEELGYNPDLPGTSGFKGMTEQGPGEFDDNEERIIDVGDSEDYEKYDFDNEFETMLGGSSDPVGSYGAGSMYEMNEIRRLAGMEPIEEKKAKKDFDGDGKIESEEDEYKGSKDKAIKKEVDEGFPGSEFPNSDIVAYDIADEKAYYVMADLLGAELDFGPEDEILVPAERNDQIIAALTDQGFELDRDYRVAGQMMDDLQNGYNDRAFTKGQDYFPKGAQSTPASELGPSASGMADNPMSNKIRMVKKDTVYENMKLAYRRHRKA